MSDIKDCFISRFTDGNLINADYSQLEVICLAHLSGDIQLISDLKNGLDMHTVRAAELFNIPESNVTKEQRKLAKSFSFQLQYGSGAKAMAEDNGTSIAVAKQFIDNYYSRYPQVLDWQDAVRQEVESTRKLSKRLTTSGKTAGMGYHVSATGRRYVFFEDDNPYYSGKNWQSATNFSPTKMKNYPVQGFATGDIVPMMLGEMFEQLMKHKEYKDNVLLINTVHDSVMFDTKYTHEYQLKEVGAWIKKVLEFAPQRLKEHFGIEFVLPLTVDIEVGNTWGSLKKLDI